MTEATLANPIASLIQSFTPTQQSILKVLADGEPHRREELRLGDSLMSLKAVQMQISRLRKILRPLGYDIVCCWSWRSWCYRWVATLTASL